MNIKKETYNRTKIVITLGPATDSEEVLYHAIRKGADIFRLNFSHGSYSEHKKRIGLIRKIEKKYNLILPILLDLQGPKIRVGNLEKDSIYIKKNQEIILNSEIKSGNEREISISYKDLYKHVKKNDKILIDDGLIKFRVVSVLDKKIRLKSINEGIIKPHKGVNLPDTKLPIPALTDKDKEDLMFGLQNNVNAVALSFVRRADDIVKLKNFIKKHFPDKIKIPIVAKIEKPEAVKNIKEIIKKVDGIMVARGDLGVETSPQEVPMIQKKLIRLANKNNKFVITATQMLESMIHNRIPTRAETTDVFNAVLDGSDAVMLSGETAVGEHPCETIHTMSDIINRAETYYQELNYKVKNNEKHDVDRKVISTAVSYIASQIHPKFIATFSASGKTAVFLSKTRPKSRLIVFVFDKAIAYYLRFFYSVFTFVVPLYKNTDEMINKVNTFFKENKIAKKGVLVLLTFGSPVGKNTETNTLKIHFIE